MNLMKMLSSEEPEENGLADALVEELKDLMSAETQLVKALPKLEKKAATRELKTAIHAHLIETKGHVERLEKIGKMLDKKLTGQTCKGMQGLIEEGSEAISEHDDGPLADAILIGAAQRVEHYEIAAYGTARAMADFLGAKDIVKLLDATIKEEGAADKKLTQISESKVLRSLGGAAGRPKVSRQAQSNGNSPRGSSSHRASAH